MNDNANFRSHGNNVPPLSDEQATVESQLRQLRPTAPVVDVERLDALLAGRSALAPSFAAELPIQTRANSWGGLGLAWTIGVAVGMLVMLLVRPPQPQVIASGEEAVGGSTSARSQLPPPPASTTLAEDDSSGDVVEVIEERPRSTDSPNSRSLIDRSFWQTTLFGQELRAGSHIYIATPLVKSSPIADREVDAQASAPSDAARRSGDLPADRPIPTPRATLDELLGGSDMLL